MEKEPVNFQFLKLKDGIFFEYICDHAVRKIHFISLTFNANPNIQRQHSTPLKHYCALAHKQLHSEMCLCNTDDGERKRRVYQLLNLKMLKKMKNEINILSI